MLLHAQRMPAVHFISKTAAVQLLLLVPCVKQAGQALQVTQPGLTFAALKALVRPARRTAIPLLNPPGLPEPLMLSYPPVPQESGGRARQRRLWMAATRF